MNARPASTDLSFGQLFLFQEKAPQRPAFYSPRQMRLRTLRLSLRIAAFAGVLIGFGASVLIQILWVIAFR